MNQNASISTNRPAVIAGSWYPDDPGQLRMEVEGFLSGAQSPKNAGRAVALISPHAGYRYSGKTAGYAFRAVMGKKYELAVVISPFHSGHPARFLTTAHRAYTTPLGEIEIDLQALDKLDGLLEKKFGNGLVSIANDREHAVEIELPFLQVALNGDFKLLPIMCTSMEPETLESLGSALAEVLSGRSTIIVASTDLSHYYDESRAKELDQVMLEQIEAFSPDGVLNVQATGKGYACGACAVAAVFWAARELGAKMVEVMDYRTSAEVSGDQNSVVGYAAAVVYSI
jgi:hypothetical protein